MQVVGFWKRFAAYFIDSIILSVIMTIVLIVGSLVVGGAAFATGSEGVAVLLSGLLYLAMIVVGWAYMIILEASSMQGTIGKKVLGIMVVDEFGQRITIKKSIIRTLSKVLSGLVLYIGYIMIGVTKEKQGLHDMIAKTYCVEKDRHRI